MVATLAELDAAAVRRWFEHALRSLLLVRDEIDRLNVFPVPDSDTGTNLVLTLAGAAEAVRPLGPDADLTALTRAAADGALLGARGNSGIIVGQCLQALAATFAGRASAGPGPVAAGLDAAAAQAREAVGRPVEGTILTVARAAAVAAAGAADEGGDLESVVRAAGLAARDALAETRGAFGGAGVDAGGVGYVVLLTALLDVVTATGDAGTARAERVTTFLARLGTRPAAGERAPEEPAEEPVNGPAPGEPTEEPALGPRPEDDGAGAFEVMYVLHAGADRAAAVREGLQRTGHSVAVVGGEHLWQVHVHTDDPAAALAGPGEMAQVCVRLVRRDPVRVGVVACTRAPGLLEHLARAGAAAVLDPDAATVVRAATDTLAGEVLVLPCDEPAAQAARTAAGHDGRSAPHRARPVRLHVAPPADDLLVLAAATEVGGALVNDLDDARRRADDARARMRSRAVPLTGDGAVRDALESLLVPGDELVTAVVGAGAGAGTGSEVRAAVAALAPAAEVVVVDGGQSSPALLLGVE
ncbi:DAK2 domain-containing protein [Georgenia daeguensis]|uniref:DAK2 domain-containing protein n=1 Tax=Georgenia daeguensis TaxID=908355 RepID=A0ABP8ETQ2_9MICO